MKISLLANWKETRQFESRIIYAISNGEMGEMGAKRGAEGGDGDFFTPYKNYALIPRVLSDEIWSPYRASASEREKWPNFDLKTGVVTTSYYGVQFYLLLTILWLVMEGENVRHF